MWFASDDHNDFARDLLEDLFEEEAMNREHIKLPTSDQMIRGLREVLEDLADQSNSGELVEV